MERSADPIKSALFGEIGFDIDLESGAFPSRILQRVFSPQRHGQLRIEADFQDGALAAVERELRVQKQASDAVRALLQTGGENDSLSRQLRLVASESVVNELLLRVL